MPTSILQDIPEKDSSFLLKMQSFRVLLFSTVVVWSNNAHLEKRWWMVIINSFVTTSRPDEVIKKQCLPQAFFNIDIGIAVASCQCSVVNRVLQKHKCGIVLTGYVEYTKPYSKDCRDLHVELQNRDQTSMVAMMPTFTSQIAYIG